MRGWRRDGDAEPGTGEKPRKGQRVKVGGWTYLGGQTRGVDVNP